MSFCRISSIVDEWEEGGTVSRFGFASGTLNEHVVRGEVFIRLFFITLWCFYFNFILLINVFSRNVLL